MTKLKNQLGLANSMAQIAKMNQDEQATKKSANHEKLIEGAPAALEKLRGKAEGDFSKMTMAEMKSIAHVKFAGSTLTGDKGAHVVAMQRLVKAQPAVLQLPSPMVTSPVVTATVEVVGTIEAMDTGGQSDEEDAPMVVAHVAEDD
eukprot:2743393-Prymnesium_polylepis.1